MKKNKYFDKLPDRGSCPCCNTKENFKKERRNRIKHDTRKEFKEALDCTENMRYDLKEEK